ncbi:glutamate formimidoyltransferase [Williamwhitmania taraxaci]|uniref:Formimidoyltransferase-cyclodeaminase n=1 Tax=Williamwhitmania taraxaci TaxID=1640674 RepID=A0A1G6HIK5_9BACT|nr:glutamate formimidoyltransferase [Williamwhitmania taraxaci]SDB93276.1 glutamate formiminotransferase / formiminotetrahydrofolate cyclodeaminase [Williamwhitmania taraxaci]
MEKKLIECVPNFSEGVDMNIIKQITNEIEAVDGVKLIDVDPGQATNRTVVTFVGTPDEVIEAAFRAVKKASELIDMSKHKGAHPRFGATDVCPLVPVANITMEETVIYAHKLAERIGKELQFPVYCYESAALSAPRKNLAYCRSGEYEGLADKLSKPEWKPDFGPAKFVPRTGAIAVGARNFLIAVNFNLNTTSTRRANAIAFDVREKGRPVLEAGKKKLDDKGNEVYAPGTLPGTKAIGWFIDEYGVAQVSMNITDIIQTPLHIAFDEVCRKADARGIRVTGTEIVGLVPLSAILEAGKYFLKKQSRSTGISNEEIIKIAVKSMGLDELYAFDPKKKIIEYILEDGGKKKLIDMNLVAFANETASESPAPGGGSIAAYMGAMGAGLGTMVANLSSHKAGWDERWEEFSVWADKGKYYMDTLLHYVDEDTNAFNKIMDAFSLPKKTDQEKASRKTAIQAATRYAIEVPYKVMELCYESMEVMKAMAEFGNPNSVTDAGVGALAARSGVFGAFLNVKINSASLDDKAYVDKILASGQNILEKTIILEEEILAIVEGKIR